MTTQRLILVAGASGCIGAALVSALRADPRNKVRALARTPAKLHQHGWADVELMAADVQREGALQAALAGVNAAYYLIHSLGAADFQQRDIAAAARFARACARAGVERIIYLGALGRNLPHLSVHLRSRHQVAQALRSTHVPVTELGAAVVIGAGSLVFELVRHLTERMPVIICPKGSETCTQPIGLGDVVRYLVAVLDEERTIGQQLEIGGDEIVSYTDMMMLYAKVRGLARPLFHLPIAARRLSGHFIGLLTPVPASIGYQLVLGMDDEVRVRDGAARKLFAFGHQSLQDAFTQAIAAASPLAPLPLRHKVERAVSECLPTPLVRTLWERVLERPLS